MSTIQLPPPKNTFSKEDIKSMLAKKDLDFQVAKIATRNPVPGHRTEESGFFTSYRTDTGYNFQNGLTKRWEPIQNDEVFECLSDLSKETEAELVNLRSFKNGAEIAAQICIGKDTVDGKGGGGGELASGKDLISNYLSVIFSHNGERSLSMYMSPKRWGCNNMINPSFRAAKAQMKKGIKAIMTIQHSQNAHDKLRILGNAVSIAHGEFVHSMDLYRTLRDTKVTEEHLKEVINQYFPLEEESTKRKTNSWKARIDDIIRRYNIADGGLQPKDSAWNLYNAVQGNIQHYTTRNGGVVSDASEKSTLIGSNETKSAQVLRTIIEMTIGMSSIMPTEMSLKGGKAFRTAGTF